MYLSNVLRRVLLIDICFDSDCFYQIKDFRIPPVRCGSTDDVPRLLIYLPFSHHFSSLPCGKRERKKERERQEISC